MSFEKFNFNRLKSFKPMISIRKNGQIGFSTSLVRDLNLKKFKRAILFYDRSRSKIGIKPTTSKEKCSFKINFYDNGTCFISAISFLKFYEIDFSKSKKFFRIDHSSDMIIFDLKSIEEKV